MWSAPAMPALWQRRHGVEAFAVHAPVPPMTHTILIVEDDPPTQTLLETLVHRYGYASVTSANGQEAIDVLGRREFAAVILDLMMPEVGGAEVIDYLARHGRPEPVVVCTAAGPARTSDFDERVVRAVVRKPFDIEALMETVCELIGKGLA
jgi:CheY-like chemotaxis protein